MPGKSKPRKQIKQAQKQRTQIAQVLRAVSNGHVTPDELLQRTPACLGRVRVFDVVRRFPHLKGDGAEHVLLNAKVWPLKRMRVLTSEERNAILANLPPRVRKS